MSLGLDNGKRVIAPHRMEIIERCLTAAHSERQDKCHLENIRLLATYPMTELRKTTMLNLLWQIRNGTVREQAQAVMRVERTCAQS